MSDETLFAAALDQPDPATRAAYLDSACPDPETRRRIDALLSAHDRAGEFLNRPAIERPARESAPTRAYAPETDHTRTHGGTVDTDTDEALGFLAPARRPDSLGRIGHYEVLEVLGRGGFGIVFRAFDETLQRVVAVKVLAPSMAATSPARKRFLREARHAGNVRHENVVQIHDISRDEERLPYLVMEFIPGETLQQRLDRTGPLEVAEILRISRQIATGLAAAHDMGLIHRDIKPSNILIDTGPQERVKITDFGLARAADDASISQSGVVAGTPMYMAPEQAKGDALDHRADLFSLGSVLYVMCTGRPPFRAESTLAVLKRVAEDDPRPIREIIPEVPEWLCRIIGKLHAKDPAERYQSAKEVAEVLADCEAQLKTSAELKDLSRIPVARSIPPEKTRTHAWGTAAVVFFAVIGASIVASLAAGAIAPELSSKANQSMVVAMVSSVIASIIAFWPRRRQSVMAADDPATVPAMNRMPGRIRWIWTAAALAFALVLGGLYFGHAAILYATNRGEVEIAANEGFNSVIVLRNDRGVYEDELMPMVTDWLSMKSSHVLKLPPGTYQLNAGIGPDPGRKVIHWKVRRSGTFGTWLTEMLPGLGHMGWSVIVTVERGERLSIWPVVEDLAAVEKRNRDAIDPGKLDTIGKAANKSGTDGIVPIPTTLSANDQTIPGWGTSIDPKGDCKFELATDGLSITVPGGKHNLNPTPEFNNVDAPRVLQRASGDFQYVARIESFSTPQSRIAGIKDNYVAAGILLWQDERNFVRFLRAGNGATRNVFIHLEYFRDGRMAAGSSLNISSQPTVLRIARAGSSFRFQWSLDGRQWREYPLKQPVNLADGLEVGICVLNTTELPFFAKFSQAQLQQAASPSATDTYTPLFNGKDTTGWSGKFPEAWTVEDGLLTGRGKKGSAEGWSELIHARNDFRDFQLRAEVKISDSGWASIRVRKQKDSLKGYKIWLSNDPEKTGARTGRLDVDGGDDSLTITNPPDELRIGADEWFTMDLVARGPELVLSINGKEAARVNDASFAKGEIQLEIAGPNTEVRFRKIDFRELTATSPALSSLDREDLAKLQGQWLIHAGELDAKPVRTEEIEGMTLRCSGDTFEWQFARQNPERVTGTLRIEAANKELVLAGKVGKEVIPVRCGYRLEGDRLRLTFASGGHVRAMRVAERMQSKKNLAQLALAMLSYHDKHKALPIAALMGPNAKDGKPLLSWRVAILPYMGHEDLYKEFKLDEPWDSQHNKKLIGRMPRAFEMPAAKAGTGMTHYRVFTGTGTPFEAMPGRQHGVRLAEILDGTAKTLLVVEAADPVIWTRPDDLVYDPKQPLPRLGISGSPIQAAFCDAKVHALPADAPEKALRAIITRSGEETENVPVLLSAPAKDSPLHLEFRRTSETRQPDPAALQPLRDLVAATARSRDQVKARFEAGTANKIDLAAAEAGLIDARIRLAEAEGNHADVIALHEALVAHRKEERELIALRVEIGKDAPDVLDQADARLADARVRLAKVRPPAPTAPAPRPKP